MKKLKLTSLLKTWALILGIILSITNCQKNEVDTEEGNIETVQDVNQYKAKQVSVFDFQSNSKLIEKISQIKKTLKLKENNTQGKSVTKGYDLNLEKAIFIENEKDSTHTYTFDLKNKSNNYDVENIILHFQKDGSYVAYLSKYQYLTKEESDAIRNGGTVDLSKKVSLEKLEDDQVNLSSKGGTCTELVFVGTEDCSCHSVHACGGCTHPEEIYAWVSVECGGGPGGGISSPSGTGNGNETSGSGSPRTGGGGTIPTIPINLDGSSAEPNYVTNSIGNLTSRQIAWINNTQNSNEVSELFNFLIENNSSQEAKSEAKLTIDIHRATNSWDFSKTGTFLNRPSLTYKATYIPNRGETMYLLENGLVLYQSSTKRQINKNNIPDTIGSTEQETNGFNYIYNYDSKKWFEYRLPPETFTDADINFLFDAFWDGAKIVGRYATPIEDIIILVDGKDFDGVEQSKLQTAGFMIVGFIPGGKILKPISKGTGKVWKFVIKNGDKVFTRTVRELTEETIQHFDNYVEGAKDLLQEALKKGEILDDEIIIDVGQEIADLSAKKGRKLTWPEVKALFKRGNDFNRKARNFYEFNEVTLKNGKRLDSYVPGQGIISRKATTLADIKPETFKSYLQELINKYPKGAEINAPKFGNTFKDKVLEGDYFLEIPLSNKTFFENSTIFQQVLTQFNVDNNVLIRIKYLTE